MILADGPSSTGWSVEKLDPNTAQNHPAKIKIEKLRLYSWIRVQTISKVKSDVEYSKAYLIFICFPGTLIEAASNSSNVCKCELDVCGPHFVKLF